LTDPPNIDDLRLSPRQKDTIETTPCKELPNLQTLFIKHKTKLENDYIKTYRSSPRMPPRSQDRKRL